MRCDLIVGSLEPMPQSTTLTQAVLEWLPLVFGLALVILGLGFYSGLLRNLLGGRGKVVSQPFSLPDLLVVIVLGSWLGGMAAKGFMQPQSDASTMTNLDIIESAVLFGVLIGAILLFLNYRQIDIVELFGLRRVAPSAVFRRGALLLLAAYPAILLCNIAMTQAMGDQAEPQEIIQYFRHAANHSQWLRVLATVSVAVFIAPVEEEFLFRGYIYGVLRKNLGVVPALLLNAGLFSAIHLNLPAMPALFVLALCLSLAYESTGSLLVPMAMHSLFNAVMLGGIFFAGA